MSRGLGKIQRKVIEVLSKKRLASTKNLCCEVFGVRHVQKKHRVAVLRAVKSVAKAKKLNVWRAVHKESQNDFWYDFDRSPGTRPPNVAPAHKPRPRK